MSDEPLEKKTRRGTTHCALRRARIIAIIYDDVFLETRTIFLGFLTRKVSLSISSRVCQSDLHKRFTATAGCRHTIIQAYCGASEVFSVLHTE